MKSVALLIATLCVALNCSTAQSEEGFKPLFNGKNLDGWVRTNTPESTWKIDGDLLVCSGKPIGELRTTKMYQNFIMEVEWRHMKPRGNAGIFIWADDITAKGVPFHRGIEVQVLENAYGNSKGHTTHGDIFPIHGAKMTPINGRGGSRAFPTESRSKPSPEWNHYRIECRDGTISLAVNGKLVTRGKDCSPSKGYICLESEGGVVHYRNAKIKELPATPVAAEHVANANRNFRSIYSGLGLEGWKSKGNWTANDWVLSVGKGAATLTSNEQFGDIGFVFDLKHPSVQSTTFSIRGAKVTIDHNDPKTAKQLGKPGRWNRFEGEIRANKIVLRLNGADFFAAITKAKANGPIQFETTGATQFANIYVRPLVTPDE
jgi:hypothetical protein